MTFDADVVVSVSVFMCLPVATSDFCPEQQITLYICEFIKGSCSLIQNTITLSTALCHSR